MYSISNFFNFQAASASEVAVATHQHQYPFNVAVAAALHNQIGPVAAQSVEQQLSRHQRPEGTTASAGAGGNAATASTHMNSNTYSRGELYS